MEPGTDTLVTAGVGTGAVFVVAVVARLGAALARTAWDMVDPHAVLAICLLFAGGSSIGVGTALRPLEPPDVNWARDVEKIKLRLASLSQEDAQVHEYNAAYGTNRVASSVLTPCGIVLVFVGCGVLAWRYLPAPS